MSIGTSNIFARAAKKKLRFFTEIGSVSVEQLWDFPLTKKKSQNVDLDGIAKNINSVLKNDDEESFVKPVTVSNTDDKLRMEIVKFVIADKLADMDAAKTAAIKSERRQLLLAAKGNLEKEAVLKMTPAEIEAELAAG